LVNEARWNRLTEWPLTVAALLFLGFYAWSVLADLQGPQDQVAQAVITATWAIFAIDYFVRLILAERRLRWFGRHLLDLAIVALPILRPLRLIRLLTLLAIFQRVAGRTLRGRVVVYTVVSTFLLVFVGALAMLDAERHYPDASITTFGDAVWWSCTTITTVGYGDLYPVSLTGRCVAVALMVGGIALLGTITATIASWLVEKVAEREEASQAATRQQVQELSRQVQEMHDAMVAYRRGRQIPIP
jgi:voltage-gated potassium channel